VIFRPSSLARCFTDSSLLVRAKLRNLAAKGMALRAIAKALTRSEESVKQRAKEDGLKIAKLR